MLKLAPLATLFLIGCTQQISFSPTPGDPDRPSNPSGGDEMPSVPPDSNGPQSLELKDLDPGWRVNVTRLPGTGEPTEETIIADGSAQTITGPAHDILAATVTDAGGKLIATVTKAAHCSFLPGAALHVPADFPTIQAAVDAAKPGETVLVAPGTYTESVIAHAPVCLIGSGAGQTILDAQGDARSLVDLTRAPGSVVAGFTLRNVRDQDPAAPNCGEDPFECVDQFHRAAIMLGNDQPDLAVRRGPSMVFGNVIEESDLGVMLYFRHTAIVQNNAFLHNKSALVANHFQDRSLVANNVFFANTGIAIGSDAAFLDILDNAVVGNALGVRYDHLQTGYVRCNLFFANTANENENRFAIGKDGNIGDDPQFVAPDQGDFHLKAGSPGIDAGCFGGSAFEPDHTTYDIGVHGGALANAF